MHIQKIPKVLTQEANIDSKLNDYNNYQHEQVFDGK